MAIKTFSTKYLCQSCNPNEVRMSILKPMIMHDGSKMVERSDTSLLHKLQVQVVSTKLF